MDNKSKIIIAVLAVLLLAGGVYMFIENNRLKEENQTLQEDLTTVLGDLDEQKKFIETEFQSVLDGYNQIHISNDSLNQVLQQEKQKVQNLLAELKMTKNLDAKKIAELRRQLTEAQDRVKDLEAKIVELQAANTALTEQNEDLTRQNLEKDEANTRLREDNELKGAELEKARELHIANLSVVPTDRVGTKMLTSATAKQLHITFTVNKNVVAAHGTQSVRMQLKKEGSLVETKVCTFNFNGNAYDFDQVWENLSFNKGTYTLTVEINGKNEGSADFTFKI